MIYLYSYLILGLISTTFLIYSDYKNGKNLTIEGVFFSLIAILFWPGILVAIIEAWYGENKYKVLIKGKKK